jgi:hypothetical protein
VPNGRRQNQGRPHREPAIEHIRNPYVYISGVFAAAWVLAAWLRPDADYVAFPVLVSGSFPISYRLAMGPLSPPLAIGAAAAGAINTIVLALLLQVAGILGGPDLWPALGAVGQSTLLGVLGAAAGAVASSYGRGESRT